MSRSNKAVALLLCAALAISLCACHVSWNTSPAEESPAASANASPSASPSVSASPYAGASPGGEPSPSAGQPQASVPYPAPETSWVVYPDAQKIMPNLNTYGAAVNQYLVTGLKDNETEDRINRRVAEELAKFKEKEPPKYPGSASIYRGNRLISTSYDGSVYLCIGNALSLVVTKTLIYDGADGAYFYDLLCLNFNLLTGELLTLEDVFADGVSPLDEINAMLYEAYSKRLDVEYDGSYSVDFYGPFTGLESPPDFYLNESGLALVFAPGTARIYEPWQPRYPVTLPMSLPQAGGKNALWSRLDSRADIYEEEPGRRLIIEDILRVKNYIWEQGDHWEVSLREYSFEDWVDAGYAKLVEEFISVTDPDGLAAEMKARSERENVTLQYNSYSYGWKCGSFYIATRTDYRYAYSAEAGSLDDTKKSTLVIDAASGRHGGLELLFRDGYDYKKELLELLLASPEAYQLTDGDMAALRVRPDELSIEFRQDGISLEISSESEYLSEELRENYYSIWTTVSYRDIGYDNVRLFQ